MCTAMTAQQTHDVFKKLLERSNYPAYTEGKGHAVWLIRVASSSAAAYIAIISKDNQQGLLGNSLDVNHDKGPVIVYADRKPVQLPAQDMEQLMSVAHLAYPGGPLIAALRYEPGECT